MTETTNTGAAPVFKTVISSKIFECMGIPILMSLPEGEATAIVRATGCEISVPPENPAALAASMLGVLETQSGNAA